jgi:hypothetical protein
MLFFDNKWRNQQGVLTAPLLPDILQKSPQTLTFPGAISSSILHGDPIPERP